ncbi:endonuclease/exonuclease/phosphatase family protein [Anaeromyxobacter sp. Fw109-5]|uniref:endonuclease/exonuclease/phosphatase family protein n=1 Tax=Anaeromyxobacter sp. (strain Fw109-5) TaxID=404589 RepID=UPI000311445C|nr:endonuclease/exonuclease/phosphatase family protein [Anaeromyxobacter sp. Fw109-5]
MPRVLAATWWLFGSTVLAGVVLRPWAGDELHVTRYTGYLMPWLLLGLVPGAAWACLRRRWALAAVLGASAATIVSLQAHLFRPRPSAPAHGAIALRVMSYNTWATNLDATRIASVVLRYRPDVLLLQEIRGDVLSRFTEAASGLYAGAPLHLVYDPDLEQAIVSRYAIEPAASLARKGNVQKVVLCAPGARVTVFNVHPPRSGGWRHRYTQISALVDEDVLREDGPVILGGDFNAPDRSQLYERVSSALANAHAQRGLGFGFTYPALVRSPFGPVPTVPLVRIDHLFFSDHFVAVRAGTLDDSGGSDHRPVFVELAPKAGAARSSVAAGHD